MFLAIRQLGVLEKLRKLVGRTGNNVIIDVKKGSRQSDSEFELLFNPVQKVILKESGINTEGLIYGIRH